MSTLADRLTIPLQDLLLDTIVSDPRTLCYVVHAYAAGEAESEGGFFDSVMPFVDGGVAKMVRKHAADEVRHAGLLSDQVLALGGSPAPIPDSLQFVRYLDAEVDGLLSRPWASADEAAQAWMLLWALERRLVERLTLLGAALQRAGSPAQIAASAVLTAISADERRHVRFCEAVCASLVSPERVEVLRAAAIEAEGVAFARFGPAFMEHLLTTHSDLPLVTRSCWRALVAANGLVTHRAPVRIAA